MLATERRRKIIEIIKEQGSVRVEALAKALNVSEMTIRRDLDKCERDGTLMRCFGGAVIQAEELKEVHYKEKSISHHENKKQIATYCATLITSGSTVYLDAGTTTYEIARLIKEVPNLKVVTNDLKIAVLLLESDVELILLGGEVQKSTGSMIGRIAEQEMENMKVEIAFVGVASIDESFDISTPTVEKAFLKRIVVKNALKSYVVADESKFNKKALIRINNLKDYTGVITNKRWCEPEQKKLEEKGIRMIHI